MFKPGLFNNINTNEQNQSINQPPQQASQPAHLPDQLHIKSTAQVKGAYTCHYQAEFDAFLNRTTNRYQTAPGKVIRIEPTPGKNKWRYCPQIKVQDASLPAEILYSADKEAIGRAKLSTPLGKHNGNIKLTDLPAKKGLDQEIPASTSIFGIKVRSKTTATDPTAASSKIHP